MSMKIIMMKRERASKKMTRVKLASKNFKANKLLLGPIKNSKILGRASLATRRRRFSTIAPQHPYIRRKVVRARNHIRDREALRLVYLNEVLL